MNKKITYFDTTSKLLQNLENCILKDSVTNENEIDILFVKEALKTLINIAKTQNDFIKFLVQVDENMELVSNDEPILSGMICYIRSKKQFGKIVEIDEEQNIYKLNILGTKDILEVSRKHFNL